MIKFFLGALIGIGLVVLASYLFVARGGIFMGTDTKPLPLERATAGAAINASIGKNADDPSPLPADEITGLGPGFASSTAAEVTFRRARTQRRVVETANAERPTSNAEVGAD